MEAGRHVATMVRAKADVDEFRNETLPSAIAHAKRTSDNLSLLASDARACAAFLSFLEYDPREMGSLLQLAARARTAQFLVEWENPRKPIRLDDRTEVFYDDHPDESYLNAGNWLEGFFGCLATRQREFLDRLCDLPTKRLRDSSTKAPEFMYVFAEACRGLWRNDPSSADLMLQAMEYTDPLKYPIFNRDHALYIAVPLIQSVFCIGAEDPEFGKHLQEALKLHREYWDSKRDRRIRFEGWLAYDLLGVAAWAHDRGLKFDVRSDYLPWSIVTGDAFRPKAK